MKAQQQIASLDGEVRLLEPQASQAKSVLDQADQSQKKAAADVDKLRVEMTEIPSRLDQLQKRNFQLLQQIIAQ